MSEELRGSLGRWVEKLSDPEVVSRWAAFFRKVADNLDALPRDIHDALQDSGYFLHTPRLSYQDTVAVQEAYRDGGADSAVAWLKREYEQLVESLAGRSDLELDWSEHPRWALLEQILAAHDAKLYGPAVSTAVAQAEGILAESIVGSGPPRGINKSALEQEIARLAGEDDISGGVLKAFHARLHVNFKHGCKQSASLARHEIMHGAAYEYGTRENSVLAILWLDFVILAARETER